MSKQQSRDKHGRTMLMIVVKNGSKEHVKEALAIATRGALFLTDNYGKTALFYAAERGDEDIVWLLLFSLAGTGVANQRGALLELRDKDGNMAEDWAKINGQEDTRRILAVERQRIAFYE